MMKSIALGIDMPDDFPTEAHNEVVEKLGAAPSKSEIGGELAAGWNAVAIRFKSSASGDVGYRRSVSSKAALGSFDELVVQQEALFAFFMNGYAAIESFAYAVFALGAMLRLVDFPMNTEANRQTIDLRKAKSAFAATFSRTAIEARLSALVVDPKFDQWGRIRNVLAHRSHPPRRHYVTLGRTAPDKTVWEITDGLTIDHQTTASRRSWLAAKLGECITGSCRFCNREFCPGMTKRRGYATTPTSPWANFSWSSSALGNSCVDARP